VRRQRLARRRRPPAVGGGGNGLLPTAVGAEPRRPRRGRADDTAALPRGPGARHPHYCMRSHQLTTASSRAPTASVLSPSRLIPASAQHLITYRLSSPAGAPRRGPRRGLRCA
jgi:hypothetical protein